MASCFHPQRPHGTDGWMGSGGVGSAPCTCADPTYTCRYCPDIRLGPLTPTAGVIPGIKIASSLLAALPGIKVFHICKIANRCNSSTCK